ncbi:hypothetical protein CI102_6935 [Trichoderma harzianum]|nr:hypothetical protein CI102_6935 [Trichoderma harzianum]
MRIVVPSAAVLQVVSSQPRRLFSPRRCLSFLGAGKRSAEPRNNLCLLRSYGWGHPLVLGANCFHISIFLWQLPSSEQQVWAQGHATLAFLHSVNRC